MKNNATVYVSMQAEERGWRDKCIVATLEVSRVSMDVRIARKLSLNPSLCTHCSFYLGYALVPPAKSCPPFS